MIEDRPGTAPPSEVLSRPVAAGSRPEVVAGMNEVPAAAKIGPDAITAKVAARLAARVHDRAA
ncbi:MAG TPA: hypothetical protein VGB88_14550, partial [Alphaproteobacteria bacterium]